MNELYALKEKATEDIKKLQKILLEKSQSDEWVETARQRWLKDIETLQEALFVIERS